MQRVAQAENVMNQLIDQAVQQKRSLETKIEELEERNKELTRLIVFKEKKSREARLKSVPDSDDEMIIDLASSAQKNHELKEAIQQRDKRIKEIQNDLMGLKALNAKYAQQAVELAARMRVYNDHNQKYAVLLSMQQEERLALEKENEMLRAELLDLNKFHQLKDGYEEDASSVRQEIGLRPLCYGLGNNPSVPRHLAFTGLITRFSMPHDAALSIVADILASRSTHSGKLEFSAFILNFLTRKYGNDAPAWGYMLNEATRHFDVDINMNLFGLVSRQVVGEQVYSVTMTDISIFLQACEIMDELQHGVVRLTVPIFHILGFLQEFYPNYQSTALTRLFGHLQATLTTNGHAHYRMLFPNLERDAVYDPGTIFSGVEVRKENAFSATFKELLVDDIVLTTQLVEDALRQFGAERIDAEEAVSAMESIFPSSARDDVRQMLIRSVSESSLVDAENFVSCDKLVQHVRSRLVLRRCVFRVTDAPQSWIRNVAKEFIESTGIQLKTINYREVLQKCETKRLQFDSASFPTERK